MQSWPTPTPDQASRAIALLVRAEQRKYFFSRLQNPEWVKVLAAKGFFMDPPEPILDDAKATVSFPPWPEAMYLVRMASHAPEDVINVIERIPETANVRVHQDLIDAAVAMPPDLAAKLVPRIKIWLGTPYRLLLPDRVGRLIASLAAGGEVDASIVLAEHTLAIVPGGRGSSSESSEEPNDRPTSEPSARIGDWDYGEILRRDIPILVEWAGVRALALLIDLLEEAVSTKRSHGDTGKPDDYSYVWRPAIEEHEQNEFCDVRGLLVTAIRDTAETIVSSNPGQLRSVVQLLEQRDWFIFRRLALHLIANNNQLETGMIADRLTNQALFDEPSVRHEYAALLKNGFSTLAREDQETILRWIDEGPDIDDYRSTRATAGQQVDDGNAAMYRRIWQRDRLAWISPSLPANWKDRYQELVDAFGAPQHSDFPTWSTGVLTGPNSPKSVAELQAMSAMEVTEYLRRWRHEDEFMGPSPEGLGRVLTIVVGERPGAYAMVAARFQGLDPTYVRAFFTGLRDGLKAGRPFDWAPVLAFGRALLTSPWNMEPSNKRRLEQDSSWSPTNQSIAELLSAGFEAEQGSIPLAQREVAWGVLRRLTDDAEPDSEYEARYGGSNMDPLHLSINTARGAAIHAAVRYALWRRRTEHGPPVAGDDSTDTNAGFAAMPEVRELLERHLDLNLEPSLAVRAVFGQWLPWIVLLDEDWVREHLDQIFPLPESQRPYCEAAWETYLTYSRLFANVFDVLKFEYGRAIERLDSKTSVTRRRGDPDERLAEHLMVMYWQGRLDLDEQDGLLPRFYIQATAKIRRHALAFIGRSLRPEEEPIDPRIVERLQHLWDRRLKAATAGARSDGAIELAGFDQWFASAAFEPTWALEQMLAALRIGAAPEPDDRVMKELSRAALSDPTNALECLERFAILDIEGWRLYSYRDDVRAILAGALTVSDQSVQERAKALINRLGERGLHVFRDVL